MPEVLSQGEIDALLSALTSGELTAEDIKREDESLRIRNYDFKRALKFSKEHIRTIERIYEHFSRLYATFLSAQLRTMVQLAVASVEQLPYEEFVRSIPAVTVLNVIDVMPVTGKILLEMAPNIAYAMLDRLLGGEGQIIDSGHRFTEIDTYVLERLFTRSLPYFSTAWNGIAELQFSYDTLEINPQFIQIANPNDIVLVVSLSITIGEVAGMLNLCMPHMVLEPIMPRLNTRFAMATPQRQGQDFEQQVEKLSRHMDNVEVYMRAELGYASIQFEDIMNLAVGDVITLEQRVDSPLYVKVGDELKYRGLPGIMHGHNAVKIAQVVEEG